jgi:hypothetical protein
MRNKLAHLFLIAVSISNMANAQLPWEDCVYVKNTIDEFKGYRVQETEAVGIIINFTTASSIAFQQIDSFYYMKFVRTLGEVLSVDSGAEFLIKLDNDSIITLNNLEYTISESNVVNLGTTNYVNRYIELSYPISESQLKMLLQNIIVKYRFYTNSGYIEDEIKKKKDAEIDKIINCILY